MAYEGQIAGVADRVPGGAWRTSAMRVMKRLSTPDVAERRAAMVAAVREVAELEFVNGGGTGSIETTVAEPAVTEVAAGSGFYAPMLFQYYRALATSRRRRGFALPVVRKPAPGVATALGGGYVASGATRADRQPVPVAPAGLHLDPLEGAGEAQTPLLGAGRRGAAGRRPGLPAPRQGRRAVRALRRAAPGRGRARRRRGADLPRRGQGVSLRQPSASATSC